MAYRRVLMIVAGVILLGVHLWWRLAKEDEPLRGVLAQSPLLNWGLFGFAWVCLLGALPLLGAALFGSQRSRDSAS